MSTPFRFRAQASWCPGARHYCPCFVSSLRHHDSVMQEPVVQDYGLHEFPDMECTPTPLTDTQDSVPASAKVIQQPGGSTAAGPIPCDSRRDYSEVRGVPVANASLGKNNNKRDSGWGKRGQGDTYHTSRASLSAIYADSLKEKEGYRSTLLQHQVEWKQIEMAEKKAMRMDAKRKDKFDGNFRLMEFRAKQSLDERRMSMEEKRLTKELLVELVKLGSSKGDIQKYLEVYHAAVCAPVNDSSPDLADRSFGSHLPS